MLVLSATPSPHPPARCYRYASIISNTITPPTSTVLQISSYYQQHHHLAHQHGATDILVLSATLSLRPPARCYRYPRIISNTITPPTSMMLQIPSYYQQHHHPAHQHDAADILVLSATPSPPPTSTVLQISSYYQQHHHPAHPHGATDILVLSATPSPCLTARCFRYPRIISNTVTPSSTVSVDFYITLTIALFIAYHPYIYWLLNVIILQMRIFLFILYNIFYITYSI